MSDDGVLDLDSGRFHYLSRGDADAPVVLCLHGFPDHPHSFVPMMERLAAAGLRAVAPWMRGYAPSVLEGPYDVERLGGDLVEMAEALSTEPVCIVGHDWGAVATYSAIAAGPARFRCAVTMAVPHPLAFARNLGRNPAQLRRSWYMLFFQLPFIPERVVCANDYALIDKLWRDWSPGYELPADERRRLIGCLATSMPAPINYYRALARPLHQLPDRSRRVQAGHRRIAVPTLYLHGADDGCIGSALGAGQERFFEAPFEAETYRGVGHFLPSECPDDIAERIVAWQARFSLESTVAGR